MDEMLPGTTLEERPNYIYKCPVCGSNDCYESRPKSGDMYDPSISGLGHRDSDIGRVTAEVNARFWKDFNDTYYKEDSGEISSTYNQLIKECKISSSSTALNIAEQSPNLQRYMGELLTIKTNIYSLEQRLNDLLRQQLSARQNYNHAAGIIRKNEIKELESNLFSINESINSIVDKRLFSIPSDWYVSQHINKPIEPKKPVPLTIVEPAVPDYKKPGLFNKKAVLAENEARKAQYEAELSDWKKQKSEYDQAVIEYDQNLIEYKNLYKQFKLKEETYKENEFNKWVNALSESNLELKRLQAQKIEDEQNLANPETYLESKIQNSPAANVKNLTDAELEECVRALKKAYQTEKEYLSINVLFPKYATLPAVSTIYEYLVSGRCNELTGATGAYNLYESEVRANRIIAQLDSINEKLDQIKINQFMLYQAVSSVNEQLSSLNEAANRMTNELQSVNTNLSSIRESSAVIAYNSAQTAYYSKVNAELTNSLGYLIALK